MLQILGVRDKMLCHSANSQIFPTYCSVPTVTSKQYEILVARDIVKALHKIKNPKYVKLKEQHKNALFKLAKIFNDALPYANKQSDLD